MMACDISRKGCNPNSYKRGNDFSTHCADCHQLNDWPCRSSHRWNCLKLKLPIGFPVTPQWLPMASQWLPSGFPAHRISRSCGTSSQKQKSHVKFTRDRIKPQFSLREFSRVYFIGKKSLLVLVSLLKNIFFLIFFLFQHYLLLSFDKDYELCHLFFHVNFWLQK